MEIVIGIAALAAIIGLIFALRGRARKKGGGDIATGDRRDAN